MKRKSIIIKGFSKDSLELAMDKTYVKAYHDFFAKNAGGAYEKSEIILMAEPTLANLQNELKEEGIDYMIVIFIGHGANQEDSQLFHLNSTEIILPGQLDFSAPKKLLLLESCRTLTVAIPVIKQTNKIAKFKGGGKIQSPLSRFKSRNLYNQQLQKCDDGMVICYACDLGESAYNYFFSNEVLKQSGAWHKDSKNMGKILDIQTLFSPVSNEVSALTSKYSKKQTPVISGTPPFPFGISKY